LSVARVGTIEQTDGAETTKEQAFHARTSWQEGEGYALFIECRRRRHERFFFSQVCSAVIDLVRGFSHRL
jgi:hypothetical protein